MPWIRTRSLDEADAKVLEAMAKQRACTPRNTVSPFRNWIKACPESWPRIP